METPGLTIYHLYKYDNNGKVTQNNYFSDINYFSPYYIPLHYVVVPAKCHNSTLVYSPLWSASPVFPVQACVLVRSKMERMMNTSTLLLARRENLIPSLPPYGTPLACSLYSACGALCLGKVHVGKGPILFHCRLLSGLLVYTFIQYICTLSCCVLRLHNVFISSPSSSVWGFHFWFWPCTVICGLFIVDNMLPGRSLREKRVGTFAGDHPNP